MVTRFTLKWLLLTGVNKMTKLFANGTPEHVKAFEQVANNKALSTLKSGTVCKLELEHPVYKSKQTQLAYDFYMRGRATMNSRRVLNLIERDRALSESRETLAHENDRIKDLLKESLKIIENMTPGLVLDIKDSIRAELNIFRR